LPVLSGDWTDFGTWLRKRANCHGLSAAQSHLMQAAALLAKTESEQRRSGRAADAMISLRAHFGYYGISTTRIRRTQTTEC